MEYEKLTGPEKIAIILNYLGSDAVKPVLKNLSDAESHNVLYLMTKFTQTSMDTVKNIMYEFFKDIHEKKHLIFGATNNETLLKLLAERAPKIFGPKAYDLLTEEMETLKTLNTKTILAFIKEQHLQTTSVIMANLPDKKRKNILKHIPAHLHDEIAIRITNLEYISPKILVEVNDIIKEALPALAAENLQVSLRHSTKGKKEVVRDHEDKIMSIIKERDPDLADKIHERMFTFEDIVLVERKGMQKVVDSVHPDTLKLALKNASPKVREKVYTGMPKRTAMLMEDEILSMPRVRQKESERAQREIVELVKSMESEGSIRFEKEQDS